MPSRGLVSLKMYPILFTYWDQQEMCSEFTLQYSKFRWKGTKMINGSQLVEYFLVMCLITGKWMQIIKLQFQVSVRA